MTAPGDFKAAIALNRFGMGARPGEMESAAHDPQGYLFAQINPAGAERFPTTADTIGRLTALSEMRAARKLKPGEAVSLEKRSAAGAAQLARARVDVGGDFVGRVRLATDTKEGFRERWALFWCNHFAVSGTKPSVGSIAGPFENEAVRPFVFGRFAEMLTTAERHPAMLAYLDQNQSVGPNSAQAEARRARRAAGGPATPLLRGLNENLAREILELHTVGVGGGYTQADVTEFARAMTGTVVASGGAELGRTTFRTRAHEPGARTILSVHYPASDPKTQSDAILADLAAKPQTARFVCGKIARHFVSDDPPPPLVAKLEATWIRTGGDLSQVAQTLIAAPEAWRPAQGKFKTPYEFIVSSHRAAGASPPDYETLFKLLNAMGQRPFSPTSPEGWADDAQVWMAPDAIIKRMRFAQDFSEDALMDRNPVELAEQVLGGTLSSTTAQAIARAETRPEGFALLLMSPEFQRR